MNEQDVLGIVKKYFSIQPKASGVFQSTAVEKWPFEMTLDVQESGLMHVEIRILTGFTLDSDLEKNILRQRSSGNLTFSIDSEGQVSLRAHSPRQNEALIHEIIPQLSREFRAFMTCISEPQLTALRFLATGVDTKIIVGEI